MEKNPDIKLLLSKMDFRTLKRREINKKDKHFEL
jgi:hypothetical protein